MTWWTLVGVETEMPWPTEDYHVKFKGRQLLLRPPTERRMAMICIESSESPMSDDDSLAILVREFMSELVWVNPYSLLEVTRSSASFLMDIGPAPLRHCRGIGFYIDYLPELQEEKPKLALAFYREAKSVNSLPYSFLGYWKVVSLLHGDGSANQRLWLIESLALIRDHNAKTRLIELRSAGETDDDIVRKRLYVSRRCAVAHATSQPVINPDDPKHDRDIRQDLPLIKAIAEHAIEFEFGVKSRHTVWKEHLYELAGFKKYFSEKELASLKAGKTPLIRTSTCLPALDIKIATKKQLSAFTNLNVQIIRIKDGKILAHCNSSHGVMTVDLLLDFVGERVEFNPAGRTQIVDDNTPIAIESAIDYLQFCCDLFSNGRIEIFEHGTDNLLGKKDPFVAENINLGGTLKGWESEIVKLKQEVERRTHGRNSQVDDVGNFEVVEKPSLQDDNQNTAAMIGPKASLDIPKN